MRGFRVRTALWALAGAAGLASPAAAQVPSVSFVFPPGGQVGTKAPVSVSGGNLQGATAVLVSGTGVSAAITKNTEAGALPCEVTIAPDAVPGAREVRVVTPRGSSNAGWIWVSPYAGAAEVEPNNALAAAQKLATLPLSVSGQVNGGEDVDSFTFQAAAGDTFVFDLAAARMASALDGYLALYDGKGRILQSAQDSFDRDPRLIYTFKTAGTYTVQVRDTMFRGGGNFVYSLAIGKIPFVTSYLPRGGRRGQTVQVSLEGVNLGSMATASVAIPMDGDEVVVPVTTPMGPAANTLSLRASSLDEAVEAEPNDAPAQATVLASVPVAVSGRIDRPGDVDLYRIKPAAAGNLAIDLLGRRIGSRIDSMIRVLDATGKELQANDDAVGKDSRLVLGAQADTEYLVEVRGLDRRAGGDLFYRLAIEPPGGQDFSLTTTPDEINVGPGGSAAVTVNLARLNGFAGPVSLRVEGLPEGVVTSPAAIPAGAAAAQFTVSAAGGAVPGAMKLVRVIGTATIDGKQVERAAQPIETYKQPLAADNQLSQRMMQFLPATVMNAQAYNLTVDKSAVTVKKGTSVAIKVTAARQMGVTQQINLTVAGQPANVNPALQNIAANANEATITLNVAGNAPEVTQNVIISGNLNNNVQVAPAVTLTIVP